MQISTLIRDRDKVLATLVTRSDNSVVTKTGCKLAHVNLIVFDIFKL